MMESKFYEFLISDNQIISKEKAVCSRIAKARVIEKHFKLSLDEIVADDELTYKILVQIKQELKDINGTISNALRKYYLFHNNKKFPVLSHYKSLKEV